ncbi:HflC protein [candidate division LCP-89 bacterium B3_LCP]|uniref:Protein HflC n=1 Tax=candidate division LCP-89 bacterium B3_LCP TaxID=2012998 RepID=A0A532V3B1_UNCL8|nr:MAG: HflC protein [candidate division LCP-89 bacterium B3_LCP]
MKKNSIFTVIVGLVIIILLTNAFYTVDETKQVIIIQLGRFVKAVQSPGLHMKIPFIQSVTTYEKRLLRYDAPPAEFLTKDKKALVVDAYARFLISDPRIFYETLKDMPRANARLDAIISSELREAVASHDQSDIITEKREPIMAEVLQITKEKGLEFGVEIIDVRIKRTDFPHEIAESIYSRMQAERIRIGKRYRSEGEEEQLKIKAETDKTKAIIIADARRQSEILRGEGDAKAIKIYADALKKNPEFYSFLRSLETYRAALGEDATLVLSANSSLFRYLEGPRTGN